ncbi:DNA-3-methyladenine glycosylase 2 family protein [Cellulomonas sp. ES6]|uniref:DNA-3-methyladenine glycosylase family protein n=1 Tax=Cellulomonas sp. ES6 TaxID=3039384 RepID=UPI0024B7ECEC|nr:DNA-3-methyladenine glycosylase 2 family protein [Cellulomonas sp. ES6]WHP17383.1 DNA-3-methyladenine glycosylase 2 family protein [Cellulomonas sp. ES6]
MHPPGDAPVPASADPASPDPAPADGPDAGPSTATDATLTVHPDGPLDLRLTLMMVRHGPGDPSLRIRQDGTVWHALRTPAGPATLLLRAGPGRVDASAWGPGAQHALAGLPDLLGARDDVRSFDPAGHAGIAAAHRRMRGLRIPRTGDVLGALVPAVLEQRVVTVDAHDAWRRLLLQHGATPPGPAPAGMRVPPDARGWRRVPSWDWRRAGVDDRRASAVLRAAAVAPRLQEAVDLEPAELRRRLLTVPGIGGWTVAETTRRALGDADAVSVGDLHLPRLVGDAVAGRRVEQDEVLEVLAPWAPHRARVVRLLELVERSTRGGRTRPLPRRAVRPA